MLVKCKCNDLVELNSDASARLFPHVYSPGADYSLEIGSVYIVFAIEFMRGGIWIYIEVASRDFPVPYPIEFFDVVDSNLPADWNCRTPYRPGTLAIVSFKEWTDNTNFYESLLDNSESELFIYSKKRLQYSE